MNISQNWKKISTNGFLQRITLVAHHQRVPDHHGTNRTQKLIKSKKHIFGTPRQTKKIKYLLPRTFLAKMHLLHFVITRHFMAACQFLSDSTGPVLRTWIFSRRSNKYRFFFLSDAKEPYPTSRLTLALHKQHDHLDRVITAWLSLLFSLLLRLRRGFIVTTAPLNEFCRNIVYLLFVKWNTTTKCFSISID